MNYSGHRLTHYLIVWYLIVQVLLQLIDIEMRRLLTTTKEQ